MTVMQAAIRVVAGVKFYVDIGMPLRRLMSPRDGAGRG
jgi:hypothetical protein